MKNSPPSLPYKILLVKEGGYIYAKGYSLYYYKFQTGKAMPIGRIPDKKYAILSHFSLLRRFFRAEITGLYELKGGTFLAVAKKGLFKSTQGSGKWIKCFAVPRGSKPLNICDLPNEHLYFGEYFMNMEKQAVNVYRSVDNGDTWQVCYTFSEGNINHIHGLFYDKYTDRMWCLTGDRKNECIIGYTEDEFNTFIEVFRGGQEYRSCQLFFFPDYIIYATDSQYTKNHIKSIDRKTLRVCDLCEIQGTAIKGRQTEDGCLLSTTVEPSEVNTDRYSHLWFSRDGVQWKELFSAKKDCLPAIMQFGSIEFPEYYCKIDTQICCSGRALQGFDGKSIFIKINK